MLPDDDITVCGLLVSPRARSVLFGGHAIELTPREFGILQHLAAHPGWVFSAAELADDADDAGYSPESVSVHVAHLRQKLVTASAPDVVETVRGFGYRLRAGESVTGDGSAPPELAHRELSAAAWQLWEAVLEVERSGRPEQQTVAATELERARRALYAALAE